VASRGRLHSSVPPPPPSERKRNVRAVNPGTARSAAAQGAVPVNAHGTATHPFDQYQHAVQPSRHRRSKRATAPSNERYRPRQRESNHKPLRKRCRDNTALTVYGECWRTVRQYQRHACNNACIHVEHACPRCGNGNACAHKRVHVPARITHIHVQPAGANRHGHAVRWHARCKRRNACCRAERAVANASR